MIWGDSHRSDHSARAAESARGWRLPGGRRLVALASAVLVTVGLAGCNSAEAEPEPDPLDDIEIDPQPDPESTDDDPEDDEPEDEATGPQDYEHPEPGPDIDDDGQAGAEAAAAYVMEMYYYIQATGDFEEWSDLSVDGCEFCDVARQQVEEVLESGGHIETAPPPIHSVTSEVWASSPGDYVVDVLLTSPNTRIYGADGELTDNYPEIEVLAWVLVEHDGESWLVLDVESEDVEP